MASAAVRARRSASRPLGATATTCPYRAVLLGSAGTWVPGSTYRPTSTTPGTLRRRQEGDGGGPAAAGHGQGARVGPLQVHRHQLGGNVHTCAEGDELRDPVACRAAVDLDEARAVGGQPQFDVGGAEVESDGAQRP